MVLPLLCANAATIAALIFSFAHGFEEEAPNDFGELADLLSASPSVEFGTSCHMQGFDDSVVDWNAPALFPEMRSSRPYPKRAFSSADNTQWPARLNFSGCPGGEGASVRFVKLSDVPNLPGETSRSASCMQDRVKSSSFEPIIGEEGAVPEQDALLAVASCKGKGINLHSLFASDGSAFKRAAAAAASRPAPSSSSSMFGTDMPPNIHFVLIDSLTRAMTMRTNGLPLVKNLLAKYMDPTRHSQGMSQAYLFGMVNSVTQSTAENCHNMFAGFPFSGTENYRGRGIWNGNVDEWVFDIARKAGYVVNYASHNDFMGMTCFPRGRTFDHMMISETHARDVYQHNHMSQAALRISYARQAALAAKRENVSHFTLYNFLEQHHPSKHPNMVNQIDEEIAEQLQWIQDNDPNSVVFFLGDHGRPYGSSSERHVKFKNYDLELMTPLVSIWLPPSVMSHEKARANLATNQRRYVVEFDLYLFMRRLLGAAEARLPKQVSDYYQGGRWAHGANSGERSSIPQFDLVSEVIPRSRDCKMAHVHPKDCMCSKSTHVAFDPSLPFHMQLRRSFQQAVAAKLTPPPSISSSFGLGPCKALQLHTVTAMAEQEAMGFPMYKLQGVFVADELEGVNATFMAQFRTRGKPGSAPQLLKGSLKRLDAFEPYRKCHAKHRRVALQFCVCQVGEVEQPM